MENKSFARGYVIAVIGTVFWATTAIFIRHLSVVYQLPPHVLAFWRDLFVAIALWTGLGLFVPRLLAPDKARKHLGFFILYGFVLAAFNIMWTTSVALNGAAVATVLAYSSPGFTALFGWRLFGERLDAAKIAAVMLSMIGCALVAEAYNPAAWQVNPLGIGVGLGAGVLFAVYSLFGKASFQRGIEGWTTTLYAFSFAALFLLVLQRPETIFWLGTSASGWGVLILLAVVPTIGGFGLYTVSLTYLPASVANLIATLEPPLTAVLAFALLGEKMSGVQLAGGGLILVGVVLLRISERVNLTPDPSSTKGAEEKPRWRYYPGTDENPFHFALVAVGYLERIPMVVMPLLLALMAALTFYASRFTLYISLATFLFSLGDLVLLSVLPRVGRSYGPPQPQALLMGILRAMVALALAALTRLGLPLEWAPWLNLAAQAIGALLAIEAYWFGPYRLNISRVTLRSHKLNPDAEPLRVLHLADLHVERLTRREQQVVQYVNALHPDVILFSGDLLNLSYVDDPRAQADCRALLSQLHAPLGVYAVTGSIPVDTPEAVRAVLEGTHIHRLDDERVTLSKDGQSLDVIGLTCTHHPERDAPRLQTLLNGQHERFSVLLYHTPDLAPESSQMGIDLQLSGHTHGGQVRLPLLGALVTSSLYGKRFEMGQYQVGPLTLYVSRGIGMEGRGAPRVRFLCPPEIVLWEIGGLG